MRSRTPLRIAIACAFVLPKRLGTIATAGGSAPVGDEELHLRTGADERAGVGTLVEDLAERLGRRELVRRLPGEPRGAERGRGARRRHPVDAGDEDRACSWRRSSRPATPPGAGSRRRGSGGRPCPAACRTPRRRSSGAGDRRRARPRRPAPSSSPRTPGTIFQPATSLATLTWTRVPAATDAPLDGIWSKTRSGGLPGATTSITCTDRPVAARSALACAAVLPVELRHDHGRASAGGPGDASDDGGPGRDLRIGRDRLAEHAPGRVGVGRDLDDRQRHAGLRAGRDGRADAAPVQIGHRHRDDGRRRAAHAIRDVRADGDGRPRRQLLREDAQRRHGRIVHEDRIGPEPEGGQEILGLPGRQADQVGKGEARRQRWGGG